MTATRTDLKLYPREIEVMQMIVDGLTTELTAYQLGITVGMTRSYIAEVLRKTDSCSREQAIGRLVKLGLLTVNCWISLDTGQKVDIQ